MDPAQGVVGNTELAGVVGNDHCSAQQAMVSDGAPDGGFREKAHELPVENIDALAYQVLEESDLVNEDGGGMGLKLCDDRLLGALCL